MTQPGNRPSWRHTELARQIQALGSGITLTAEEETAARQLADAAGHPIQILQVEAEEELEAGQ